MNYTKMVIEAINQIPEPYVRITMMEDVLYGPQILLDTGEHAVFNLNNGMEVTISIK